MISSGVESSKIDAVDFEVITTCLLGPFGVTPEKTEGPASRMEVIGFTVNMMEETIGHL
jgi:hypothetical protein